MLFNFFEDKKKRCRKYSRPEDDYPLDEKFNFLYYSFSKTAWKRDKAPDEIIIKN